MADSVVIREYAELTTAPVKDTLDRAHISQSCFDWLLDLHAGFSKAGKKLLDVPGRKIIKLDSYVGFLQSPCGTTIEILPKYFRHTPTEKELVDSRKILLKMIAVSLQLPYRETGPAQVNLFKYPLPEWIYGQFLQELDKLFKRGLRFEYQQFEEEKRFLRGQLDVNKQLRQPPGKGHLFQVRHEIFTPDRPENRLIKLALDLARSHVNEPENWRLTNELSHLLNPIPASRNYNGDFKAWKNNRLMISYRAIRPWCELIIHQLNPTSQKGLYDGISLLFPMEKLFENYVTHCLQKQLKSPWQLKTQASSKYLCTHKPVDANEPKKMFQLKPDLVLLLNGEKQQVLDTKWKRVDGHDASNKYGLSQADFYQLFAYGHKYMDGRGDMMLIYPSMETFQEPIPFFDFGGGLKLWVVPFDLNSETLAEGEWVNYFPAFTGRLGTGAGLDGINTPSFFKTARLHT